MFYQHFISVDCRFWALFLIIFCYVQYRFNDHLTVTVNENITRKPACQRRLILSMISKVPNLQFGQSVGSILFGLYRRINFIMDFINLTAYIIIIIIQSRIFSVGVGRYILHLLSPFSLFHEHFYTCSLVKGILHNSTINRT